ncbi:MAG TPA: heavy metal-associated domain-containing protein [Flavobacteriales bacterium]|jgi:uncharacterized membrane protein YraQ (UPF0718 family)/copper chaperone CopZ|nr:heavy metal-associated domain-containing protein [Flavobacteriales bacterium]
MILNTLQDLVMSFIELFAQMAPYLLLGFFLAGVLHVIIPRDRMIKYLGKSNFRSVFLGTLVGIPLPLCSCGVIPTGISLYKDGASKGATNSFLISTPQTGVDSVLVTYSMLGLPFALIRPIAAFISGIAGGVITNKTTEPTQMTEVEEEISSSDQSVWKRLFQYAFVDFMQDIYKWLLIGIVIAAGISVLVPDDFFVEYLNQPLLSMVVILLVSIPMYVCATGSIPIAAVLMLKGLSPGAAFVFLMAGPATNAATISVIRKSMGNKSLWAFLISIVGMALLFGYIINTFLPINWFDLSSIAPVHHHEEISILEWTSATILAVLILNLFRLRWFSKKNASFAVMSDGEKQFRVNGMTCNHCKSTVEKNLAKIEGLSKVHADFVSNTVTVSGDDIDAESIERLINELGYDFKGEA